MSNSPVAPVDLRGKVAVVTGAGRGLGRSHALALARAGAAVLVNDLGSALDGSGVDDRVAAAVVAEITALGGTARADGHDVASIEAGRSLVERAFDWFGRIDIVVNNAGFASGGGTVAEPDAAGIEALLDVHLGAALGTMSAAFQHMTPGGRIINTVSEVALDARFVGSLGYGIAKAALWSATLSAAEQARPLGITVNAISPGARTRMNAALLDDGFRGGASAPLDLDPAHVSDVVLFLVALEAADVTGCVIHAAAGLVREYTTKRHADSDLVRRILASAATHA